MDKEHPLSSKNGRVYHHRHVYSVKIGRWVRRHENVHHKDENRANNIPSNLRLKSHGGHARMHSRLRFPNSKTGRMCKCDSCHHKFRASFPQQRFCNHDCASTSARKFNPSATELGKLVWSMPMVKLKNQFGVSDVAIKKRCKKLGIATPPMGFWAKSARVSA